jgi:hypothetical protein
MISFSSRSTQLKGYRFGWAERARATGMPEREEVNHLGHKSKAVHRAYAARAKVVTLPLEHYERRQMDKILEFRNGRADGPVSREFAAG